MTHTTETAEPTLTVGAANDAYEQQANAVAGQIMRMPEQPFVQRKCAHCQEKEQLQRKPLASFIQRKTDAGAGTTSLAVTNQIQATQGGSSPLPATTRTFMETRFGTDFSGVNIHTGEYAVQLSRELNAQAFTVGSDIYFNQGKYAPESSDGKRLLAHELTHTVQQSGRVERTIQRQEDDEVNPQPSPFIPLPGTGLSLMPGPLRAGLLGSSLPLPASLRLTNALGVGSGPSFVLNLAPERLMLHLLQNIDLQTSTIEGTPPGSAPSEANTQRLSLINPTLTFTPASRRLSGWATLSIPSGYPLWAKGPTLVNVQITSSEIGQFAGQLNYGPLHADMTLQLHYDTHRLENTLSPVFTPAGGFSGALSRFLTILRTAAPGGRFDSLTGGIQSLIDQLAAGRVNVPQFVAQMMHLIESSMPAGVDLTSLERAITQLTNEIAHPGFTLAGGLNLFSLPLSRFSAEAPTTVPIARPLLGAPAAFPIRYTAYGAVIAPPGSLFTIPVPALGVTHSNFGERSGTSITAALLPTISPDAISAGRSAVEQFPVYAYLSISNVQRVSNNVDLGVRFTVQMSTPQLLGRGQGNETTGLADLIGQYQGTANSRNEPPPTPTIGAVIFGSF